MDKSVWDHLLGRYGQKVSLVFGSETREVRAFFQPVREKQPGQEPTPLGYMPRGCWLYLGPAEPDPDGADGLIRDGKRFRMIRCRRVDIGLHRIYQWGLAEACEGEAEL